MCNHDPQYQIENEQMGGFGCPICNAQRVLTYEPGCALGVCADCNVQGEDCTEMAFLAYVERRGDMGNDPAVYSLDFSQYQGEI